MAFAIEGAEIMEERLLKAIKFFRTFEAQSDRDIYRRSVLKFCDLVEQFLMGKHEVEEPKKDAEELAREVFSDIVRTV